MAAKLSIEDVNGLDYEEFITCFAGVVEHGMLIAGAVWSRRPFTSVDHLHQAFCNFMDDLPKHGKQSVLRCHPNLAGKLALQGNLTRESTQEQAAAGLGSLTDDEFRQINEYNAAYRKKFAFPFVICARENKIAAILNGMRTRIHNAAEKELETGIGEVKKISYYRLLALVVDSGGVSQPKL